MTRRTSAALLSFAVIASLAFSSPVIAAPALPSPPTTAAPASTTVPFSATTTDTVAGGVVHRHGRMTTTAGPQVVELIDVDPAAAGISLEVSSPAAGPNGLETVRSQATRVTRNGHRVIAAINGDTFGALDATVRAPTGLQVHLGELITGSVRSKPTLGFDADEHPRLGDVVIRGTVTLPDGTTTLGIDRVNKPRLSGDLILYTRRWGASTKTSTGGAEVVLTGAALPLRPSGSYTATVASVLPTGSNTAIPVGSLVLSAQGADATALARLVTGSVVTVKTTITSGWEDVREAISGREWLVEAAHESIRPVSDLTTDKHPRTAIGLRADGTLTLATVDGRWPGYSVGVTASELAGLFIAEGAVGAIMLDGGGSTTALVRRPGDVEATLRNKPSDGRERAVNDALLVVSTTPTGPLDKVLVRPGAAHAVVGETVGFQARGVDAAINGVSISGLPVAWSVAGGAGTVATTGSFRARDPGESTVKATVGQRAGTATVTVEADTFAPLASAPITRLRRGGTVGANTVPLTISWPAATDIGTGVVKYEIRRRLDGGPWTDVVSASASARSLSQGLPTGRAVQYQIRATDGAGNVGAWQTGAAFYLRLASEGASGTSYTGRWVSKSSSSYLGGKVKVSTKAGATATYSFTGSQVAWIAPFGSTRGSARIYIDGTYKATVSLRSSATYPRRAAYTFAWSSVGKHRIMVRVSGTVGHSRIDVDGFAVVDSASAYPVLVGAGDISTCANTGDSATSLLLDRTPGTVFAAGDNVYESGTAAEFASCYGPTWGQVAWRTSPVPGNHEYVMAGAAPYYAYFGSRAGTPGQGWYAYDLGTWRVYGLNSNCAAVGGCGPGSAQEAWLRDDLAANPRVCVAAVWHHPLFSSGKNGGLAATRPLWDALAEAGADVVINGHDHDYERFAPQRSDGTADAAAGMREFVVGTGGAGLRPFASTKPNSEARNASTLGVLRLELKSGSYTWRFLPVAGSTWSDTGSTNCH